MHPLPTAAFDLVVVTRYLQRDLFPSLRAAVRPGGLVVYETFTVKQRRARHAARRRPIICSSRANCARCFDGLGRAVQRGSRGAEAVARIVARKPSGSSTRTRQAGRLRAFSAS